MDCHYIKNIQHKLTLNFCAQYPLILHYDICSISLWVYNITLGNYTNCLIYFFFRFDQIINQEMSEIIALSKEFVSGNYSDEENSILKPLLAVLDIMDNAIDLFIKVCPHIYSFAQFKQCLCNGYYIL